MITQEIVRYKAKHTPYSYTTPTHVPQQYPVPYRGNPEWQMGKMAYALYLQTLPYKVGDLVVPYHCVKPYADYLVCRVRGIDEIHRFVVFAAPAVGPLCLELEELNGRVRPNRAGAAVYKRVDPADYPDTWKERLIVDA